MRAQAARWKAKNSRFCSEPGNQQSPAPSAAPEQPTHCVLFCGMKCQDNAEQLCQGGRDGREGERQPSTPWFWEPAMACASSPKGFSQGKREVTQALPQGSSVSNMEQFVQPPCCCPVFAPCPGRQSPG